MRFVDFLIALLEAHAQTLQRLAALFGEERLLEMLESAGEDETGKGATQRPEPAALTHPEWIQSVEDGSGSAYAELEGAIHEMNLPAVLEFHLWAYPLYRAYIESSFDLGSKIQGAGSSAGTSMVNEAVAYAEEWIKCLPMPPGISQQAERAAQIPWLRFRAEVLKRIGKRPLGPVY